MLLKLSAEAVRLRRLTKAFGAGECSQADYRSLRREIIDNYAAPVQRDVTERRVPEREEVTLRTVTTLVNANGLIGSGIAEGAATALQPTPFGSLPRRLRTWLFGAVLMLLLFALLLVWPVPGGAAVPSQIAPVRERAPDPANSQRIAVAALTLEAPEDLPPALRGVAERALNDAFLAAQAAAQETEHGFTPHELAQVAQLLQAFGVHEPDGVVSAAEAEALSRAIREQKRNRGLSVRALEQIADRVQAAVRDAGLLLAVAYVPAQTVADGEARITLLPGRLGTVATSGDDGSAARDLIQRQFGGLENRIVSRGELETRLGRLALIPGLSSQVRLEPGATVGTADLNIDLMSARPYDVGVAVDNHGYQGVGEERLSAWFSARNALGRGEELDLAVLQTLADSGQRQFWARYRQPWLATGTRLGVTFAHNDFQADDLGRGLADTLGADGVAQALTLDARQLLYQTRRATAAATLAFGWQDYRYDDFNDQTLRFLNLTLNGERIWDRSQLALSGAAGVEVGLADDAVRVGQDESYYRIHAAGRLWRPLALRREAPADKLVLRWRGQWSDSDLPPGRALVLGRAQSERGFEAYRLLADRALSLAFEWRRPVRIGELYGFFDSAYGSSANELDAGFALLTSAGVGWDAAWSQRFSSRLSLGLPLAQKGSPDPDASGVQLYWRLDYAY
ncbi:MAG: ShlB/FhaC/HecB family hemolysin secretion/activation protein [Pseudomonadota bacterium]